MRMLLIAMVGLVVAGAGVASAAVCGNPPYEDRCVIDNGLAPPNSENIIDDDTYVDDWVYVRNVGCPPGWPSGDPWDSCPSPGAPTDLELADGGQVFRIRALDSSTITMNGGTVADELSVAPAAFPAPTGSTGTINGGTVGEVSCYYLSTLTINGGTVLDGVNNLNSTVTINGGTVDAVRVENSVSWDVDSTLTMNGGTVRLLLSYDPSTTVTINDGTVESLIADTSSALMMNGGTVDELEVRDGSGTITGGTVGSDLLAHSNSTITMNGGTVGGTLQARWFSTITIVGRNFEVDGVPVPHGDLTAQTGTLSGTLASGDPINNVFYQGGWTEAPCDPVYYPCSGTITLVKAAGTLPTLSPWSHLALMAGLLGTGLGVWRGRGA